MERKDRELIRSVIASNVQLKRLYQEHVELEERLARFEHRKFLTPKDELELKQIKKLKLMGVDRMMIILSDYRGEAHAM